MSYYGGQEVHMSRGSQSRSFNDQNGMEPVGNGRPPKNIQIDVEITPRGQRGQNYHVNDNYPEPNRYGSRDERYDRNVNPPNHPQQRTADYSNGPYVRHNFSADDRRPEGRGNVSVLSNKSYPNDNRNSSNRQSQQAPVQYVMKTKTKSPGSSRSSTLLGDFSSQDALAREYADRSIPVEGTTQRYNTDAFQHRNSGHSIPVEGTSNGYDANVYRHRNDKHSAKNNTNRRIHTPQKLEKNRITITPQHSRIPVTNNRKPSGNRLPNGQSRTGQTPNKGYSFPDLEDEDYKNINLDDIESEYGGGDMYLCYLMTDEGAVAGPMKLDVNDVQLGLPSHVEVKDKNTGMRNRQTGSHGLNEFSSRSHSMLTLTVDTEQQDPDDETLYLTKRGKLTFVDLAGSEKVKDSESSETSLKESNNINRSLLVLGNCISSLGDAKKRQGHIPYRDSKLTKLLADSLGGNGVTLMIACVTPSSHHASETMNTLRYASRAKRIKTKPIVKMDPREKLILSLKREIKILRNENVYLRQQLEFPSKPKSELISEAEGKFTKNSKPKEKETKPALPQQPPNNKNNKGSTEAGLYEMLQEYMIENEALRSENSDLHSTKDKIKRDQQLMWRENERLMRQLESFERNQGNRQWQYNGPQHPEQFHEQGPPNRPPNRPPQGPPHGPPGPGHGPPGPHGPHGHIAQNNQQWKSPRHPAEQYPVSSPQNGNRGPPSKPPNRAGPKRPPHRLPEPIMRQVNMPPPEHMQNGIYHDDGYMSPRGRPPLQNGPARQPESPMRVPSDRRSATSNTTADSILNMNEKLKQEIMELEGEIEHHHMVNQRTKSIYGSQTSVRSGFR